MAAGFQLFTEATFSGLNIFSYYENMEHSGRMLKLAEIHQSSTKIICNYIKFDYKLPGVDQNSTRIAKS